MSRALLTLALRLFWRDWRAGELRILLAALIVAVGASSAIGLFTDRLQRAMAQQSAELLGGDLVLRTPREINPLWLEQAEALGLRHTTLLQFPSMLIHGEKTQMVSVKAAAPGYPLRGHLRTRAALAADEQDSDGIPPAGEAWAQPRLFALLDVQPGDRVQLGEITLRLGRVLSQDAGGGSPLAALAPRLLINQADLAKAGLLGAGSRVSREYLFAGGEAALARYRDALRPQLEPAQSLLDVREDKPSIGAALERAERYLGLAGLLAVLLAGVAIAMGARHYSERHLDLSALLRCFGAQERDVLWIYLPQWLLLGALGGGLGLALGGASQIMLFALLREWLPARLPAPGLAPLGLALLTGLIVLAGFALPPVLRLRRVPALRVLRRDLGALPPQGWLIYAAALVALALLMCWHAGSWTLALILLMGAAAALALLLLLVWLTLRAGRRLQRRVGASWRYGLHALSRQPLSSAGQILAFGLTLTAMALIVLLRGELIADWRAQLPPQTPNQFIINILPHEADAFGDFLRENAIQTAPLYPLVRGRLIAVNERPIAELLPPGDDGGGALNRELNLTWSATLPTGNRLLDGRWWRAEDDGQPLASLEEGLAKRLGAGVGDRLRFDFGGGQRMDAQIVSLRSVRWDSFQPNFFVIFPPGALDGQPNTYMTSLYAAPKDDALMANMARRFPAISVINLEQLMAQVRRIMTQLGLAVEYVLIFVLLAGLAVLYAALAASLPERRREAALLRALGASRRQLRGALLGEFALLGLFAGLFAALSSELIAWQLYRHTFDLTPRLHPALWLALPPLGALLTGAAGALGTRNVASQSPLRLL